jgi:electron transport complex protein RnfC
VPLPSRYPQGAEKVLVHNTVGRVIPEGKLPGDVGVIVMNVTTIAALAKYIKTGMPLVERSVTVDGSAVAEPKNVTAPIGTSIGDIIDFAGGLKCEAGKVLFGGPMMGYPACYMSDPIIKTTGAITVLSVKDSAEHPATACIHCGRCVSTCPVFLNPTEFSKALELEGKQDRVQRLEENSINLCMECGCCAYVCPAARPLIENIRIAKNSFKEYKAHKSSLK